MAVARARLASKVRKRGIITTIMTMTTIMITPMSIMGTRMRTAIRTTMLAIHIHTIIPMMMKRITITTMAIIMTMAKGLLTRMRQV